MQYMMRKLMRKLKNRYHWSNKIKVSASSVFTCDGELMKTTTHVIGRDNIVVIGYETCITGAAIVVDGDGNQIMFGDNCHIQNNQTSDRLFIM
jgi:S-adenosylhomocysteine hydrolase